MSVHDVLVPLRFLALLGHFLATLLCLYAVRDNVLVALPFTYDAVSMENGLWSARPHDVTFAVLLVNAISLFGGFSTFDTALSLFHLTFPPSPAAPHAHRHQQGPLLLSVVHHADLQRAAALGRRVGLPQPHPHRTKAQLVMSV